MEIFSEEKTLVKYLSNLGDDITGEPEGKRTSLDQRKRISPSFFPPLLCNVARS